MGLGAHSALTEIVVKENGEYKNVLKHKNEYDFSQTFKPYPLFSTDINNDGIIEIGIQTAPPQTEYLPMAGIPWINNWYQWDGEDGLTPEPIMEEYSNHYEGYRFIIPTSWRGKFTIDEKADEQYRVNSVHFIYLGANHEKAELLIIHHIPKENWSQEEQKFQDHDQPYVLLGENDKNMLVAEIKQNNDQLPNNSLKEYKKMILDQENIIRNFFAIGNNLVENKENITTELTKELAMKLEQQFFYKALHVERVGATNEIKNYQTKETLIDAVSEAAHEKLAKEFVDEFFTEKDGRLYIISRGAPAQILPNSPYDFNQIDEYTYEIIQDEADMMRGPYRLKVEFKYLDGQWKISNRNTEFKNSKKDIG